MIEVYLREFVSLNRRDWVRLLPMVEFAYNNTKNTITGYTSFKFNCSYHPRVLFKEDVNSCSRSCSANKLAKELRELMEVCY